MSSTTKGDAVRNRLSVLATIAVLLVAVPASAEEFVPVLETEDVFFRCTGNRRLSQADLATSIRWTTDPPTSSVAAGGGCASHDSQMCCSGNVSNENYIYDAVFMGDTTGNLDTLTVNAWALDTGISRPESTVAFNVYLAIDGKTRLDNVPVTVESATTDGVRHIQFSVTNIGLLSEQDHTRYHDVHLVMKTPTYSGSDLTWVFDATEVPSGITFNPAEPVGTTLRAR